MCNNLKYSNVPNSGISGVRCSSLRTLLLETPVSCCECAENEPAVGECCVLAKVAQVVGFQCNWFSVLALMFWLLELLCV